MTHGKDPLKIGSGPSACKRRAQLAGAPGYPSMLAMFDGFTAMSTLVEGDPIM